jgi:hypothetical protein
MGFESGVLENLIHLALFVGAIGFVGVVVVAVLERLTETSRPLVAPRHIAIALAVALALAALERLYHLLA